MNYAVKCAVVDAAANFWADTVGLVYHDAMNAAEVTRTFSEVVREWVCRDHYLYHAELAAVVRPLLRAAA